MGRRNTTERFEREQIEKYGYPEYYFDAVKMVSKGYGLDRIGLTLGIKIWDIDYRIVEMFERKNKLPVGGFKMLKNRAENRGA